MKSSITHSQVAVISSGKASAIVAAEHTGLQASRVHTVEGESADEGVLRSMGDG